MTKSVAGSAVSQSFSIVPSMLMEASVNDVRTVFFCAISDRLANKQISGNSLGVRSIEGWVSVTKIEIMACNTLIGIRIFKKFRYRKDFGAFLLNLCCRSGLARFLGIGLPPERFV